MKENNYFFVPYAKEMNDIHALIEIIKKDGWMDSNTIIVTCSPEYTSLSAQIINHKLSYLNNNQLYEHLTLETPFPGMCQIWNAHLMEYEIFDTYLKKWTHKYVNSYYKYLFLNNVTTSGKNFSKIRAAIKDDALEYRFASLYMEKGSSFRPDYFVQEYEGKILFEWENSNIESKNY